MTPIKIPKKLIEVALPLDIINKAAAREKSIRYGHPSTLHLWWARRPLAAARAVIFAQMVNDPGYERHLGRGINKEKAVIERERIFKIIEKLVQWENIDNETVLQEARNEILKSWHETCELNKNHPQANELFNPKKLPAFHDPFAGGGAIPLEALRLGLESYASDLNPVAVIINKAMIEIPQKFIGHAPVGSFPQGEKYSTYFGEWPGATGLAEDVRRYGAWMHAEAKKRIGYLYPKIEITAEMAMDRPDLKGLIGEKLTIVAWLWVRTVKSPNPAYSHVDVPLASTFLLSSKYGKEAWVKPIITGETYNFSVKIGAVPKGTKEGTKTGKRGSFYCLLSSTPIDGKYIKNEGRLGCIGNRLLAIVAEGKHGRVYLSPTIEMENIAKKATPNWSPQIEFAHNSRHMTPCAYGLTTFSDLFTPRQLVALNTFSDLIVEVIKKIKKDEIDAGALEDTIGLSNNGLGTTAYAEAIATYLSFGITNLADRNSSLCGWVVARDHARNTFNRQALSMVWDYAESNPLSNSSGNFFGGIEKIAKALEKLPVTTNGFSSQENASNQSISALKIISTDPPYYDNVPYADLSDFFFVWQRYCLKEIFPKIFATITVPKSEELVADSYRHGSKEKAEIFFLEGMSRAIHSLAEQAHPAFPITIYYAFKQSQKKGNVTTSTGWETFLEAVIRAGFAITGTWPVSTEREGRTRDVNSNALASSIVLVCRKRSHEAVSISRRDFIRELNATLPESLYEMTRGGINSPVAPVDLSQAIIGPGMAIFSQYSRVLEANGSPMTVRAALQLINRFLGEEDFDNDTQFCLHWFETHGWIEGKFGEADVLARAKGTSVNGLQNAGVVKSAGGNLCLLRWHEYSIDWVPEKDNRISVWEALHQLIRALNQNGELVAGALLARMPALAEPIRALAYRLYTLCERMGWAEEARAYNEIINAWTGIEKSSHEVGHSGSQAQLDI